LVGNGSLKDASLADFIWHLSDGTLQPHLLKLARQYYRANVFTSFNILKEMDLAGGTLSYEGIDVIRRVETGCQKYYRGSMIPSKSEIKRMAGLVEWCARGHCPYTVSETDQGEVIVFDYAKAMLCVTKAFGLDEIGKLRSLSFATSLDGASLSKNLSIVAAGVKVIDRSACCPFSGRLILQNPLTMRAQSRNLCLPFIIRMGRETMEAFRDFGPFFAFMDALSKEGMILLDGIKHFLTMTYCDLAAQWKGLGKGGAAKVHNLPCTGCATESENLATPNNRACTRWCHAHSQDVEWMCYHKPMATPLLLARRDGVATAVVVVVVADTAAGEQHERAGEKVGSHYPGIA
jgi:hypothetical protein